MPRTTTTAEEHAAEEPRAKHIPKMLRAPPRATAGPTPANVRSLVRLEARPRVARVLRDALQAAGVTSSDLGAAMDLPRARVLDMLAGTRPIDVAHLVLAVERCPAALGALRGALLGMLVGKDGAR